MYNIMGYKKFIPKTKYKKNMQKYVPKKPQTFEGVLQATERGFAFIIPDDKERFKGDLFVPKNSVNGAFDGDKVLFARVMGTADEATVIKVLQRKNEQIIGTLQVGKRDALVHPDNPRLPCVFIPITKPKHPAERLLKFWAKAATLTAKKTLLYALSV